MHTHIQCQALQWLSVFFLLGEFFGGIGIDSKATDFRWSSCKLLCTYLITSLIRPFRSATAIITLILSEFGVCMTPPLWSSGQSFWLQIQRSRVRFAALPDFLSSSGSGTGSTQPREVN